MTHIEGIFRDHKPTNKPNRRIDTITCACGCRIEIPACDRLGRPRKYVKGHVGRMQKRDTWSEAQKDKFRALWLAGETIRVIGVEMGMPRSTVPGRALRMGLPGRGSPLRAALNLSPEEIKARKADQARARYAGRAEKRKRGPILAVANSVSNRSKRTSVRGVANVMVDLEPSKEIRIDQLHRGVCAYPTSSVDLRTSTGFHYRTEHRFCGCKVEKGKPYCGGHMQVAYVPTPWIEATAEEAKKEMAA